MFNKVLAYLLVLLTLSSGYTRLYIYAVYELNKNYITNVLCENKASPQLKCEGKCYLKKKIKQAEKSEQKSGQGTSKQFFSDVFLITDFRFKSYIRQTAAYLPANTRFYFALSANGIFHPPQAD